MFKKAIIITVFLGLVFQSFAALPNTDFLVNNVNSVLFNIVQPIQIDRNSADFDVLTQDVIDFKLTNESNNIVYIATIENETFHSIDISNLPLGTYDLEVNSKGKVQYITIVLED